MTSYCPQVRYAAAPDQWLGGENTGWRYATFDEAQASLTHIKLTREDLLESRVIESRLKPTRWKLSDDQRWKKPIDRDQSRK
jgi:hypothetical protein